jgi:flagellar basal-body rod modification protein FlgD
MSTSPISAATAGNAASTPASPARIPTKTLGQEDFLKILVAQTRQQDPFKDGGLADMMSQFMALGNFQAMQDMSGRIESSAGVTASHFARALLGTHVVVADGAGATRLNGGAVHFTLGGREYAASSILSFETPNPERP